MATHLTFPRAPTIPAPVRELARWELDEEEQRIADNLVTETDEPLDSDYQGKVHRLLVSSLYTSWKPGAVFWAASNVGVWIDPRRPAAVPDVFVALDPVIPVDRHRRRSYFYWETKKPPTVVVEMVSNRIGGEMSTKLRQYAEWGIPHYAVFDPFEYLSKEVLQAFTLDGGAYSRSRGGVLESLGLGLRIWDGLFEDLRGPYPRWCDKDGVLLPTGYEKSAAV
jgi:Uma2 family endonuclease